VEASAQAFRSVDMRRRNLANIYDMNELVILNNYICF